MVAKKVATKYYCDSCDYATSRLSSWNKHISTLKHKSLHNPYKSCKKVANAGSFVCPCGKTYKHRQTLHAHKKVCTAETENPNNDFEKKGDLVEALREIVPEIAAAANDLAPTVTNNINVQVFLDSRCGDAMTIQAFATQLTLSLVDLTSDVHPSLISSAVLESIGPIPVTDRPMHCMDPTGRTWQVNDAIEGWKEDDGKTVVTESAMGILRQFQNIWDATYPDWRNDEELKSRYAQLVSTLSTEPSQKDMRKALSILAGPCRLSAEDIPEPEA